ncbi:MAG TPA: response regulator transcription factor [Chloroflexota bacterium]|jgi:two-component system response regulator NreC|nr:response regulator transcription factor [Chloroflexota bacterium]
MIRVLLADDHTLVREGIRLCLQAMGDMQVIGEAADGREAVAKTLELRPDVVLMDVSMPGLSGIEATLEIKRARPEIQVVGLSMYDDEEYATRLLRAGAAGYVLKRSAATELGAAVRAAHAGEAFLHPSIAKRVISDYLRRLDQEPAAAGLTPREREILGHIVDGKTNREIAELLTLSVKTVENHRTNLMAKLDAHDRGQLVRAAERLGLVAAPDPRERRD